MNRSAQRKLISRSIPNQNSTQKINKQKQFSIKSSFGTSQSKQKILKQKNNQQREQKNIFYSQLRIQTYDKDVPLVKILKVNQDLQNKFIYYSTSIQKLTQILRIRSLNKGFRSLTTNLVTKQRNDIKIQKITNVLTKLIKIRCQQSLMKLFTNKSKTKIKQKALIVFNRLIISKMNSNFRYFLKNCSEKRMMKFVMDKVSQDETIKLKMNLQIFRQITFSKEFISKCRFLTKYNSNNKTSFQNELNKQNFLQNLQIQMVRYQKIRQNVDNTNPNDQQNSSNKKNIVKRKPLVNENNYYENQIVLMAIKSFNFSLIDMKKLYEEKVLSLHEQIQSLQSEQRYLLLQTRLKQSNFNTKAYESLINQFFTKSDQEIKKIINQYPQKINNKSFVSKLTSTINSQKSKYQKLYQKIEKAANKKNVDEYLSKMYQTRCFTLSLCENFLYEQDQSTLLLYQNLCNFFTENLNELVLIHQNESKMRNFIEKHKRTKNSQEINNNSSTLIINLSQSILFLLNRPQKQLPTSKQQIRPVESQKKSIERTQRQTSASKKSTQTKKQVQEVKEIQQNTNALDNSYTTLIELIKITIFQYLKNINNTYQTNKNVLIDNLYLKKSLLPETKGRNQKIQENIEMNGFVSSLNSQIITVVQLFKSQLSQISQVEQQKRQILQMINQFYELIICSSTKTKQQQVKFDQLNKKWINYCKSKTTSRNSQQKLSLINTFNEMLMLFKEISLKNKSSSTEVDFSQQLKKILKQKLQFQRQYHQIQKKYLIRDEEYKIIQRQNKQYLKKQIDMQKQLNKLKNQSRFYTQKQQKSQITIERYKNQQQVYVNNAKTESQQNNRINRELNKFKSQVNSLTNELQRIKNREKQRTAALSQQKNKIKNTYTLKQFSSMQNNLKIQISQLQNSITTITNQKNQLYQNTLVFKDRIKDLQKEIQQGKFQNRRFTQEIQKVKYQNNKFLQIQESYQRQIQKLEKQIQNLKQQIQKYKSINISHQLNNKSQNQKSQYDHLLRYESQYNIILSESQFLKKQVSSQKSQILKLNIQMTQKDDKLKNIEKKLIDDKNSLKIQYQTQIIQQRQWYMDQLKQVETGYRNQQLKYQQKIRQFQTKLHIFTLKTNSSIQSSVVVELQPDVQFSFYDPQQQIQSLKAYILTLERQNENLNKKYNQLKKQLYLDDTSTTFSTKSHTNKQMHSLGFYQSLVHDLKLQNDRLYDQILTLRAKNKKQTNQNMYTEEQINQTEKQDFWLKQIRRKQIVIQEKQKIIYDLKQNLQETHQKLNFLNQKCQKADTFNSHLQTNQLKSDIAYLQQKFVRVVQANQIKQNQLLHRINILQQQVSEYRMNLNHLKHFDHSQPSNQLNFNYEQLLQSTKEVKQLFTRFIQATNQILQKLQRTSQLYLLIEEKIRLSQLNSPKQYERLQSEKAYQSILALVQQFKTVIQNNHQTLKSIYQNLVCHPYTKTALQLQYLQQLTFNLAFKFSIQHQDSQLAKVFLMEQIQLIFKNNQNQKITPIQETYVKVEEFLIQKLGFSLNSYKKDLHLKAIQLDYLREKINIFVDKQLISQNIMINRYPHDNSSEQCDQSIYFNDNINYKKTQNFNHNYQYENLYGQINNQQRQYKREIQRPNTGYWVSETASNYQYRPLTSVIQKLNFSQEPIQSDIYSNVFRSSVQKYQQNQISSSQKI